MNWLVLSVGLVLVSACAGSARVEVSTNRLTGPKEIIVLTAPGTITKEITKRLQRKGFVIKFLPPNVRAKDSAKYGLSISADYVAQCFGGGYRLRYLDLNLYDLQTNQIVLEASGSGYTENCPPLSGTVFQDVVGAIVRAWN